MTKPKPVDLEKLKSLYENEQWAEIGSYTMTSLITEIEHLRVRVKELEGK